MTFALNAMTHVLAAHKATSRGKQRNLWAVVGLNAATLGLYSIYWWYTSNRELRDLGSNRAEPQLEKEPVLSALAFTFGGCLVVPLIWTAVTTARRIQIAQHLAGATRDLSVATAVTLLCVPLLAQFVNAYTPGALAALIGGTLAFRCTALAYMQRALNEVWALDDPTEEASSVPVERLSAPTLSQV
jgi:hypothetical protein